MRILETTIAALAAISLAGYAQAQDRKPDQDSGAYGGLGVAAYVTNPENAIETELFAVEAKLGYNFNKYFGVEVQGSLGLNTNSRNIPISATDSLTEETKADYSVAGFAVARLPINESFEIFARGGVHNTQISVDIPGGAISDFTETETGLAVGAGGQFNFDRKNAIRFDYLFLDDTEAETLSLGYVRKF